MILPLICTGATASCAMLSYTPTKSSPQQTQNKTWQESIDVRDFVFKHITPYDGDESFLEGPTEKTKAIQEKVKELSKQEREKGGCSILT